MYSVADKDIFKKNLEDGVLKELAELGITIHPPWLPVYKYVSVATAKEIIKKRTLWFRPPIAFNDPFEFSLDFFDFSLTNRDFKLLLDASLQKAPYNYNFAERERFMRGVTIRNYVDAYKHIIETARKNSLVFCGSAVNTNTLMWSHYGDCHKGVCIGLEMPTVEIDNDLMTLNVNYAPEIIPQHIFGDEKPYAKFYWIYTKARDWAYEQEVRTFIANTENKIKFKQDNFGLPYYDIPFPGRVFKEIYYGLNAKEEDVSEIKELLRINGIAVKRTGRMRFNKGSFGLAVEMEKH